MCYMWSSTRRDSPLRTGLFLYLAALLLQQADPIGAQERCQVAKPEAKNESSKNMVADTDDYMEKGCRAWRGKPVGLKQLERALSRRSFQEDNFTVICPNIQALVFRIQPMKFRGLNLGSESIQTKSTRNKSTQHSIRFPAALVPKGRRTLAEMKLVCVYLNTRCLFQDGKNSSLLNDDILGATLENSSVTDLSEPVEIRFWHNERLDNSNAICVFWVEGTENGSLGNWSSAGCETIHQDKVVLCQCKHLTYFAVLLKISSAPIDEAILAPLTYISMVGCSVSAAASLLTILHYLATRKKSRDYTTKIHMNLLGALFLLNVSFLLSGPLASVHATWLCRGTAAFLQYSLLCCLTWMAIEGFHLYLLLIKVYNVYISRYVLKLCAVGWGLPALAVVSILTFKEEAYGLHIIKTDTGYNNATMCWITDKAQDVHYILNVGYAGITVLFNMVILVTVTRMLRKLRSNMNSQTERVKKDLVTVLGLTCLLGTTWALAFLSFSVFLIPQLILFTIINSLLGFFICLWYCTIRRQPDTSPSTGSSQMTK
ncbi:transcriptional repressor NF-X1 [Platysternon megacephalum]|uniref:Transcriptional repressor NF-X1 n=1 Tax=Platysternon megacephalum TaxID=55544 RepID=A0A4D9DUV1_9SAUR|nr:transcriptional repressor NF-X1 [Platysternon megacephalum]